MHTKGFAPINLFFLLLNSPWPFYVSVTAFSRIISFIVFFKVGVTFFMFVSLFAIVFFRFIWWNEVYRERSRGNHTNLSLDNLKIGIILFILREVCFFAGFFWRFFHYSFIPALECGDVWPPFSLRAVNPFSVPLLNTVVLLRRGATVTFSHIRIINNTKRDSFLLITLILGVYFTSLQALEYYMCSFTIRDRVFGSIFFIATGFHGLHVLIGSIFLFICFIRILNYHFRRINHLGYEMAIWYWHFVDVVWLFLFSFIYWWGF